MDAFETIRTLLAIRQYQDKPVPAATLRRIVEAGRLTGSAKNLQPWHFVVVEDRATLQTLGALARTGAHVAHAAAAVRGEPIPAEPTLEEQRELMLYHYRLVCDRFGEQKGTVLMRKFACCYAQGRPGAREFRKHVATVVTREEFTGVVDAYFPRDAAVVAV